MADKIICGRLLTRPARPSCLRCKDVGHRGSKSDAQPDDVIPKPIENVYDAASRPNEQLAHDDINSPHSPADGASQTDGDGGGLRGTNQDVTSPKLCTEVPQSRQTRPPALTLDKASANSWSRFSNRSLVEIPKESKL
ncbi:hypothetical protein FDECE_8144 [Fusarium decemcellulare]|nr:hypothetical protein FDECE_8144 [Fusarium decemcellulare]